MRARLRRLRFGLATLLGAKPQGFFLPYRHAASVNPRGYPALEPLFRLAEPAFAAVLATAESWAEPLLAIASGAGPARFDQDWFPRLDAIAAYAILRRERPARIVEIGSGHSTRFMARAIADGGWGGQLTAIDPTPRASLARLAVRHVPALLGEDESGAVDALRPGDVLFVDSSHLAMPGTDVDRLVGDVLPRLPAGVFVHFHDILLPDPYPADWTWRGYNEATVVAALIGRGALELVFASHWVATRRPDWLSDGVAGRLPLVPGARETSLWLRTR